MPIDSESEQYEGFAEEADHKVGLNAVGLVLGAVTVVAAAGAAVAMGLAGFPLAATLAGGAVLGVILALTPRVALQWERAVVLTLGRYTRLKGPGLFWVMPFVERPVVWIDLRVRTTTFAAEKTLTADTVPVDVDAVLFWQVENAERAALAVEDYRKAVSWAAQTALRDIIGKTFLANMLTGREVIDEDLQKLIVARTHDWGIVVRSVEIRDVMIPPGLEDAMSRQAQAEREKRARVILSDAEVEISANFEAAAVRYVANPTAMQLRAMNILYEGIKEKGSLMVVPSGMVEALAVGGVSGLASQQQQSLTNGDTPT